MRHLLPAVLLLSPVCSAQIPVGFPVAVPASDPGQITLEVRVLTAPDAQIERLKTNNLIRTPELADTPQLPEVDSQTLRKQGGIQLVSATRAVRQAMPVFVNVLDDGAVRGLLQQVSQDADSDVLMAPKVMVNEGQPGTVQIGSEQPFVVEVNPVDGELKPRVEYQHAGMKVSFRAASEADGCKLDVALQLTDVDGRVTHAAGPEGAFIQVPVVQANEFSLSALIAEGRTLAVTGVPVKRTVKVESGVPILQKVPHVSKLFKNSSVGSEVRDTIILITPRQQR
ncbi:MAG: type II and III secretion system protein [Planctomycetaceae bacterium]|nr:type II and III secretion system protein [Planctomycetaceae bacterium]